MLTYNTYNTPNLDNLSPFELALGRKPIPVPRLANCKDMEVVTPGSPSVVVCSENY